MRASQVFRELRRRKVFRTAVIYAGAAWLLIEVATTLGPVLGGPDWLVKSFVITLLLGLPVAITVSWMFDLSPEGLRPEPDREPAAASRVAGGSDEDPAERRRIEIPPPAPTTPLIGREREATEIAGLLRAGERLVTLTGTGGTGKTRLCEETARRLGEDFEGGVAYVPLAPVAAAGQVMAKIADVLDLKEAEERSLLDGVSGLIGSRRVLLVLDNFEHLLDAAVDIGSLLGRCPRLQVLATSRAPLKIAGEREVPLRPLALPPTGATTAPEDLSAYAAIALFTERAARARAGFALTARNAEAIAGICRRLDGLPLAIELAAARMRVLEPEQLLAKLEHALDVLTTGARDLPERQRTLRATIDWSYSLLDPHEQRLLRRLAVFRGGWTHAAVERICYEDDDAFRSLDELQSLVEKGLVQRAEADGRFGMLETIREYATEALTNSGEAVEFRRRHANHFRTVTMQAYHDFRNGAQVESLQRIDGESANVEEALAQLLRAAAEGDADAAETGLSMCFDLWMYWHVRGRHLRARSWCRAFLDLAAGHGYPIARARALFTDSLATLTLGDALSCLADTAEAERLGQDDPETLALTAITRGVAHLTTGALDEARVALESAVQRGRRLEGGWELGIALSFLGMLETACGRSDAARACFDEALPLQRAIGDHEGMGASLGGLAALEAAAGHAERALALYREAFDAYHAIGDRPEEARILDAYAWTALSVARTGEAREHFVESLRAYEEVGSVRGIGIALLGLAATEAEEGEPERAVRIAAASAQFSQAEGVANDYAMNTSAPRYLDAAREALDPSVLAQLEEEGRALSVRAAVRYALEPADEPAAQLS